MGTQGQEIIPTSITGAVAESTKQSTEQGTKEASFTGNTGGINSECLLFIHFFINKDVATERSVMNKTKKVSTLKELSC